MIRMKLLIPVTLMVVMMMLTPADSAPGHCIHDFFDCGHHQPLQPGRRPTRQVSNNSAMLINTPALTLISLIVFLKNYYSSSWNTHSIQNFSPTCYSITIVLKVCLYIIKKYWSVILFWKLWNNHKIFVLITWSNHWFLVTHWQDWYHYVIFLWSDTFVIKCFYVMSELFSSSATASSSSSSSVSPALLFMSCLALTSFWHLSTRSE